MLANSLLAALDDAQPEYVLGGHLQANRITDSQSSAVAVFLWA